MSIIIDDAGVNGADGKNVYVGNLSWETDDAQLLELVSQYGTVTSAHVETSKSGRSLGYGLAYVGRLCPGHRAARRARVRRPQDPRARRPRPDGAQGQEGAGAARAAAAPRARARRGQAMER